MPLLRSLATAGVLAGAMALSACSGGGDDSDMADSSAMMRADTGMMAPSGTGMMPGDSMGMKSADSSGMMLSDPSTVTELDQTIAAAEGGLTKLAPATAVSVIRMFETKLENSNDPALDDIAKDLEKLREELEDDTVDGKDVGEILRRLGPKVTAVASKGGAAQARLTRLGGLLTTAGNSLR